jgi:hypothetical protein
LKCINVVAQPLAKRAKCINIDAQPHGKFGQGNLTFFHMKSVPRFREERLRSINQFGVVQDEVRDKRGDGDDFADFKRLLDRVAHEQGLDAGLFDEVHGFA